jgi:hypothetical protein
VKRSFSIIAAIGWLAATTITLAAEEASPVPPPQYTLGDQTLSINGGLFIPLFFLGPQFSMASTNLSLGGVGSLNWAAYVMPQLRVGVEVGGSFSFSPNMNALLTLAVTPKASWIFTFYPFEVPVSLGMGMNIVKYIDQSTIDLFVKPGISLFWIFSSSWSFGLNAMYWWDMMFASDSTYSRSGNFLEISLCALYHY